MEQVYEFFDSRAFDSIWEMSWADFIHTYKTRWALNRRYHSGEYQRRSLRELLAFSGDPEPSPEQIEHILKHQTICWTIRHSTPQLFVMSTIISDGLPDLRRATISFETSVEVDCLLAAAVDAYLEGRMTRAALRAVMKLHSIAEPSEFLDLTRKEKRVLRDADLSRAMWKPIYGWQGMGWLTDESCANGLAHTDTKRFVDFVIRAWNENWPTPRLTDIKYTASSRSPQFRDFDVARELARRLKSKGRYFKKPCVFLRWS